MEDPPLCVKAGTGRPVTVPRWEIQRPSKMPKQSAATTDDAQVDKARPSSGLTAAVRPPRSHTQSGIAGQSQLQLVLCVGQSQLSTGSHAGAPAQTRIAEEKPRTTSFKASRRAACIHDCKQLGQLLALINLSQTAVIVATDLHVHG